MLFFKSHLYRASQASKLWPPSPDFCFRLPNAGSTLGTRWGLISTIKILQCQDLGLDPSWVCVRTPGVNRMPGTIIHPPPPDKWAL